MKKTFVKYIIIGAVLVGFSGCSNFEEINTSPNATTSVSSQMLATNLILNVTSSAIGDGFLNPVLLSKALNHTEFPNSWQYNTLGKQGFDGLVVLSYVQKMVDFAPEGG